MGYGVGKKVDIGDVFAVIGVKSIFKSAGLIIKRRASASAAVQKMSLWLQNM